MSDCSQAGTALAPHWHLRRSDSTATVTVLALVPAGQLPQSAEGIGVWQDSSRPICKRTCCHVCFVMWFRFQAPQLEVPARGMDARRRHLSRGRRGKGVSYSAVGMLYLLPITHVLSIWQPCLLVLWLSCFCSFDGNASTVEAVSCV